MKTTQTVQISCNICYFHQAHALPTMLISLPICFYAELIIEIPGKCRLRNFYLVLLLKISTDEVTT